MQIEFMGFAGDCLISGRFQLSAKRLTDQLNADPLVTLEDVVLEGLDGQRVVRAPLGELAAAVGRAGIGAPSVVVIGDVVDILGSFGS